MGTPLTGREALCALKKATTWRTPVACGANDGLLILSESLAMSQEELVDDSLGAVWPMYSDLGKSSTQGSLDAYMRYDGLDVALALIAGAAGTPAQQETTTAYKNTIELADNIVGKFATLAIKKKSDVIAEYPSLKLHGFKLAADMKNPVKATLNAVANKEVLTSATNTVSSMGNVTYPDVANRLIMNANTAFRINDKSGLALSDSDKIYPSSFEFNFNRPTEGDLTVSNDDIDEPGDNAFPEASVTLNFPRYNDANHAFFTDWNANTEKKMEIYFRGNLIEGSYYREFKISMPHVRVANPTANASGPGKIPMSVTLRLLGTNVAPSGMTGITKMFQIDVTNTRTTSPLA